jgi:hypothetical protein
MVFSFQEQIEDNQKSLIQEGQATQCPKENGQKDKRRSSKHYKEN